ncbi:hypothetical protein MKK70_19045 [Methylobacterium sp. E-041]|jgi:hypothetical protein|uniref:hypothetical protein n=1 Tax=unclassified Methylobacterium TaxID=2615210 RepID=UPI0011C70DC0|nr:MULTISPECIES: hypothetical protein [unclassified Methylobacterium]MCJ2039917.1 hypothetical protein [Methylobacterium sp. J-059]MCJ2107442.1 hypothetical protein [Methylobacterium sp. E-041]MCJ2110574.1 hypothetical protein [Methylobacterium sp. E-025]TXM94183.1 hypothetical protein FV223_05670 [Methylobacterium sp. WL116]TXN42021.1 hypothetical protein FV225_00095 [Methylobacterium sp. WL93]
MSELLSVALVCAGTLLAQDCSRETALDVIVSPARTPMECIMHAQTMAAAAGLPGGDHRYLKVSCEHRRTEADPVVVVRRAS